MSHVPLSVTPVNAKDRAARRRYRGHRPPRIALDLTQLHGTFHHAGVTHNSGKAQHGRHVSST